MRRFLAGVIRGDFNEPLLALVVVLFVGLILWAAPWKILALLSVLFLVILILLLLLGLVIELIMRPLRRWADKNAK